MSELATGGVVVNVHVALGTPEQLGRALAVAIRRGAAPRRDTPIYNAMIAEGWQR